SHSSRVPVMCVVMVCSLRPGYWGYDPPRRTGFRRTAVQAVRATPCVTLRAAPANMCAGAVARCPPPSRTETRHARFRIEKGEHVTTLLQRAFRRKPVAAMTEETGTDREGGELVRSIGLFQLTMIGIGSTIGTGIFFVLSETVPVAGPAVIWAFVIAGAVAGLTAVCYAELAGAVPVSGSSYSYAYAALGEVVAMGVAACLLLEYGVSSAAVAVG